MVEGIEQLLVAYRDLGNVLRRQLALFKLERTDESIDVLNELEKSKMQYKLQIDVLVEQNEDIINTSTDVKATIISQIQQLQMLNAELQAEIEIWYDNDSSTMRQVSHHQKTLRTYGGVNFSDNISYYIDSKK